MPIDPLTTAVMKPLAERVATALWDCTGGYVLNLFHLRKHAREIAEEMARLDALKTDLNNRAAHDARQTQQAEVMHQISQWTGSVETLLRKACDFQKSFSHTTFCRVSGFCLGHKAVELLRKVKTLTDEGRALLSGSQLINQRGPDAVHPVPSEISRATMLVGAAEPLQKIKNCILDEGIGIIGIYGMGGVGKTTLLKIINNDFLMGLEGSGMFDVAIWVTVSRQAKDIPLIQKTIANRLGLPSDAPVDKDTLFRKLSKRRFVLLLDDVWERLDLVGELGVPLPRDSNNNSKILFTTRSEEVCCDMDADEKVKVGCLDEDASWELFRSKFGKKDGHHHVLDDDPVIQPLAKEVVNKCGGLPISLVTVGRAMALARTEDDWRVAITKLDHRPADLSQGMENDVLQRLKFSFDRLRTKTLQDCLLYLALFPEDRNIRKEEIIDYWICEGFLDSEEFDEPDIEYTRRRARKLITELQNACLLEVDEEWPYVKLHDIVRDMALWISKESSVVLAGSNCIVSQVPKLAIWQKATKISLMWNKQIREPPSSCWDLYCPNLTTLLLRYSRLAENIPHHQGFFTCTNMPTLKVLNLMGAGLEKFPIGIASLISLRYLSMRSNKLTSLPVELGNLVNLRILILSDNVDLQPIPLEALRCLSNLQVLDMRDCLPTHSHCEFLSQSELENLKNLGSLCELHLRRNVCSWVLLQGIVESLVLRRSIRELRVCSETSNDASPSPPTGHTISQQISRISDRITFLQLGRDGGDPVKGELELHIDRLQRLEGLCVEQFIEAKIFHYQRAAVPCFSRLKKLRIVNCGCYDLTWISRLPCLGELQVMNCGKLGEILSDGCSRSNNGQSGPLFFPKLTCIQLTGLPSLRSISSCMLLLPSLERLSVDECPKLKRLPFRLPSLRSLSVINCGELEAIFPDGNDDQTGPLFFPELTFIQLKNLASLRNISTRTLLLSSLKRLRVGECPQLKRLPFKLPCLDYLTVENCRDVEEIFSDGSDNSDDDQTGSLFFQDLTFIQLRNLPSLRSIGACIFLLPSLKSLMVDECPQLKRLPLGSDSAPNINAIRGSEAWWNGLEWDDDTDVIRERFSSRFVRTD